MNTNDRREAGHERPPLEVETLISDDQRRVTVDDHAAFREAMAPPAKKAFDPIDELVEELRRVERESP